MAPHLWPGGHWQTWRPPHRTCNRPDSPQRARAGSTPSTRSTRPSPSMRASRAPAGLKPAPAGTQSAARDGRSVVFCSVYLIGANAVQALRHSKHTVQRLGTFAAQGCDVAVAEKAAASLIAQGERDQAGTDVLQPALFANQAGLKGVAVGTGHGAHLHLAAPLGHGHGFTGQIVGLEDLFTGQHGLLP